MITFEEIKEIILNMKLRYEEKYGIILPDDESIKNFVEMINEQSNNENYSRF